MFYIDIGYFLYEFVECIIWLKNIVRFFLVYIYCIVLIFSSVIIEAKEILVIIIDCNLLNGNVF